MGVELIALEVKVPQRILDLIGFSGWEALSWVLQNQWVQEYKLFWSNRDGYDIGVADTVSRILNPKIMSENEVSIENHCRIASNVRARDVSNFKDLMIEGYLLGTDFVSPLWVKADDGALVQTGVIKDEHGNNQLMGELARYYMKKHQKYPSQAKISERLIEFCFDHGLYHLIGKFASHIGVPYLIANGNGKL